ncbi:hypothetical protein L249_3883 [Ophiocordyceps polyrhachis-furcata BCC 54312]|uniref:tRNA (uracil-O(2)-)-methyltransferase n=1 Tax=Ophiocordyceps polyrhachis-furcata BCC 54312 TaxID=1330021 RepID=A0A367L5B2_9HYPO|nr:hypothetical protein L249_3883 [Ophiocordyceps polyrhachis-furcata BCC 54312]
MPPVFQPDELPPDSSPGFEDETSCRSWVPLYRHGCTFGRDIFVDKMMNLIRNPNLNSSWLFRADILYDDDDDDDDDDDEKRMPVGQSSAAAEDVVKPLPRSIRNMTTQRTLVRTLIPRNQRRDKALDQTCTFHRGPTSDLVIYAAHADSASDLPFYHPAVRAVAHLHSRDPTSESAGSVSILVLPFGEEDGNDVVHLPPKVRRTAYHLLQLLHKHGQSSAAGYVKRVHHDRIVPQARMQNRYAALKDKYARRLVESWLESTDPLKHVFEDLAIAAFLIDLWSDMYNDDDESSCFPGFVDIGCGNGLLVYILAQEGYRGWGFDARARKSWSLFRPAAHLEQRLLLPSAIARLDRESCPEQHLLLHPPDNNNNNSNVPAFHDGNFPPGTFIISNHADELTAWTPILAAASNCPFIVIPCCSHNLAGDRFRAPPPATPRNRLAHTSSSSSPSSPPPSRSTYASLVDWVSRIAHDCGWFVEKEMLRIPSTRNTCLLSRRRRPSHQGEQHHGDQDLVHLDSVIAHYGGCQGYRANLVRLIHHHTDASHSH